MKILIVGSGGREHAIAWKIARAQRQRRFTALREMQELQESQSAFPSGPWSLRNWQILPWNIEIDLTVVGMDDPLVGGIVDVLRREAQNLWPQKECGHPGRIQGILQGFNEKIRHSYSCL